MKPFTLKDSFISSQPTSISSLGTSQKAVTHVDAMVSATLLPSVSESHIPADCVAKNCADVIDHGRVGKRFHIGDSFSLLIDGMHAKHDYTEAVVLNYSRSFCIECNCKCYEDTFQKC